MQASAKFSLIRVVLCTNARSGSGSCAPEGSVVVSEDATKVAERGVLAVPEETWRVAVHRAAVIAPLGREGDGAA